jgi:hypothetical protein
MVAIFKLEDFQCDNETINQRREGTYVEDASFHSLPFSRAKRVRDDVELEHTFDCFR